jgi:hypothetical protein
VKNDIRAAQTHVYKSGGRQPAVGIANASAVALVCHGRLTPTALVLRCERSSAKKTFFAMNKRTFTRAAGVSPPWIAKRDYAGTATFTGK